MKKAALKNPRAKRMLDMLNYSTANNKNPEKYDEGKHHSEIGSLDASESQPNPNSNANSRSESTTSSLEVDFNYIDQLIDSKINSPASISNLSIILGDTDFVASPTAVYKVDRTPSQIKNQHIKYQTIASTPNTNQTSENINDETLEQGNATESVEQKDTLKEVTIVIEIGEIFKGNEELYHNKEGNKDNIDNTQMTLLNPINSIIIEEDNNENNDNTQITLLNPVSLSIIEEENKENNKNNDNTLITLLSPVSPSIIEEENKENSDNTLITLLNPMSPVIIETNCNLQTEIQHNVIDTVQKTRKRCCNEKEWCDNKNKRLKNSGKSYEGARSKKMYSAKTIGPPCSCKKRCGITFSMEQRQEIFDTFYRLKDHELQWQYIVRHLQAQPIKRMTLERKSNRTQTIKYYFKQDQTSIQVCKVFFLSTLQISEQVVFTALEKIKKDESLIDNRGCHYNRPHRMSDATKKSIMTHIDLFPSVESHYTRKRSKRQYLSQELNISKMYRLYTLWFPNQEYTQKHLGSKRQYESIFNTQYNYSFFKPKKDLCGTCSLYEQADEPKIATLEGNYQQHLLRKTKVREIKEEEKATADKDDTTVAIFDLEKVLHVPQSEVGIFHYKRKYPVYNFTVYNALNKSGHCYVWHLSIAKRGSIEIGSCLLKFINMEGQRGIKYISFYSDGCTGQNKNRYVFALYLYAIKKGYIESITHRFFETGHSQNEGDSMHSLIERAMKNKVLYTPDQVYGVIMNAKVTGDKYNLIEMEQTDFYNTKDLITGKNWTTDTQGSKIAWTKIVEVKVSNSNSNIVQFKYNYDDQYLELNTESCINRSRRSKQNRTGNVEMSGLKPAYSEPIAVSKALLADLLSLCRTEAIPAHYHSFYNSLQSYNENSQPASDSDDDDDNGED